MLLYNHWVSVLTCHMGRNDAQSRPLRPKCKIVLANTLVTNLCQILINQVKTCQCVMVHFWATPFAQKWEMAWGNSCLTGILISLNYLEGAHECLVNAHHGAGVVKFATVVRGREKRHQLPLRKELVSILHYLCRHTEGGVHHMNHKHQYLLY